MLYPAFHWFSFVVFVMLAFVPAFGTSNTFNKVWQYIARPGFVIMSFWAFILWMNDIGYILTL